MTSYALLHTQRVTAKNGEVFTISPDLWERNQQQQSLLLRYFALPLKEENNRLWLGVDSLSNLSACETIAFITGKLVEPVLLESTQLKELLQQLAPNQLQVEEQVKYYQHQEQSHFEQQDDEPVIRLLNQIFESALQNNASDIHLETLSDHFQVRFRIDGVLQVQPPLSKNLANRIISRLKLLAKLDISETRLPQDGRFQFKTTFSDILDFRLSTLPTHWGEKIVLRAQQNKPVELSFSELGMTENQQQAFQRALSQPQGLILVTGPTGSGKSISLYTALQWLNTPDKHIMTAEDPIEIELDGIIQSQINPQIGLDFNRLLRTFLRQDPDIIMLGEIRDEESARIALRAAQTGHLVLSTLHTNDAISAISRLQQLGIQQYEIENSLLLVIAQRLVRKLCSKCGGNLINSCDCNQGYRGRIGVYQFLHWQQNGYQTDFKNLRVSGLEKVNQGMTDNKEIERVLGKNS
ncbi:TPA: GspE/PulE family protein [Haemophilus influenzae]|uniref:Type II secretion system protein E n=1 Tax=Haemophilus influenzae TaxID=727 RepID=A0A2S9RQC9_HAEIF|nr:GspE/PulE family protein [Haemophilus influenzae]AWP54166.1 type II/IV secretion system protein [Haemophilus influenzae]PRI38783.1 Type II secretion system protein E [Haemophilus influenzae]PRI89035.1 Type II secretion system protein E [Haemophilus influenzae]PRI89436.1 Type II secretion system protein E [Haemophilus influenzae]PRJ62380.1 Type II secretion system protein E [Haemophilus influenzae]